MMARVLVESPYELYRPNPTDSGYDLRYWDNGEHKDPRHYWADGSLVIPVGDYAVVPTGVRLGLDSSPSMMLIDAQVRGRSGLASRGILVHPGTIDHTYHGEIKVVMFNLGSQEIRFSPGDRIAQLVFSQVMPIQVIPVDNLSEDLRGGLGSSGIQ